MIKKNNGEHFARTLRDANVLELPDIVELVRYAGRNADEEFILYLQSLKSIQTLANAARGSGTSTDPFELLHRAGYSYVEYADTLEKQNAIKKYFAQGEELCTFNDPTRYQQNYILNAVRFDADTVKRSDKPDRQDAYGTSVISIQMRKSGGFISIKNRYNHSVEHPDNTFDSNPDNIIPGLSVALKMYFDVDFEATTVPLPNGMTRIGDHIIKYNFEINNMYIGDSFWESHGQIHEIDRSTQVMMDYFIFDIKQNRVVPIVDNMDDGFADVLNAEIAGRRVTVRGKYPNQSLWVDDTCLVELDGARMKSLNLPNTKTIGNGFLKRCNLFTFRAPNLTMVGNNFLSEASCLNELNVPRLQRVGNYFINSNYSLIDVDLPNLQYAGHGFMSSSNKLTSLSAPQLTMVKGYFLDHANKIQSLSLPNLIEAGDSFMQSAKYITSFDAPRLTTVGEKFLENNEILKELYLPSLTQVGEKFMTMNNLVTFVAPNLNRLKDGFFGYYKIGDSPLEHLVLGPDVQWDNNARIFPQVHQLIQENKYAAGIDRVSQLSTGAPRTPPIPTKSKDM